MAQLYNAEAFNPWQTQMARSAFMDKSNYVLLAGSCTNEGKESAFVIQYTDNLTGWQLTYPGPFATSFNAMVQLKNGTYMAIGTYFTTALAKDKKMWVVNLDNKGKIIWSQQIRPPRLVGTPIETSCAGMSIAATADGGCIITGLLVLNGKAGSLVVKLAADLTNVWEQQFDGLIFYDVQETAKGEVLLSGGNLLPENQSNPVVVRLDAKGRIILNKVFVNYKIYVLQQCKCIALADGNFVFAGKNMLIKFDTFGKELWARNIPNGNLTSVLEMPNANLAVAGSLIVSNSDQAYVAVIEAAGNKIVWDNSEIASPSAFMDLFLDPRAGGVLFSAGYLPYNLIDFQAVFVAYNPAKFLLPVTK